MTRFRESERQRFSYLAEDVLSKAAGADLKLDHTRLAERVEQAAELAQDDRAVGAYMDTVPVDPTFAREIADDAQKLLGMLSRKSSDAIRDEVRRKAAGQGR
jgi:hypothetical protein